MKAIIFAGGTGKRLWPLSRKDSPKQIKPIFNGKTSLQHSLEILSENFKLEDIFIATSKSLESELKQALPELPDGNFIFESSIRDTGPALSLAMCHLFMVSPDEPVVIRWQNSLIKNSKEFTRAVKSAAELVESDKDLKIAYLVVPSRFPNTTVGYIKLGKKIKEDIDGVSHYNFDGFVEKPEAELAQKLHDEGHGWNPGCYISTPRKFLGLLEKYRPEVYAVFAEILEILKEGKDLERIYELFDSLESISVDYLLWEKLQKKDAKLVMSDYNWWYVSTWENLLYALADEGRENVIEGQVELLDSHNSLVFNDDGDKLIVGIGLEDMCVVNHGNVILVCPSAESKKVKDVVNKLSEDDTHKKFL